MAEDGCWLWTASLNSAGYGQVHYREGARTMWGAHRLIYKLLVGDLPEELHHECFVRRCVNPAHLVRTDSERHLPEFHRGDQCLAGHDLTDERNIYWRNSPTGKRSPACRPCRTERERKRRTVLGARERAKENAVRTERRRRQRARERASYASPNN